MTREEAIECLNFQNEKIFGGQSEALKMAVSALSADVRPNIHATWEKVSADKYIQSGNYRYRCSMCGELTIGEPNFCPTCGADMREPKGEKANAND